MIEQSPTRKALAALAAMLLTVAGFQQLMTVPSAYAAAAIAPLA